MPLSAEDNHVTPGVTPIMAVQSDPPYPRERADLPRCARSIVADVRKGERAGRWARGLALDRGSVANSSGPGEEWGTVGPCMSMGGWPQVTEPLVIARALDDRSICVFQSLRYAEGYVEATDIIDGEWGTFYGLDGQVFTPEVSEHKWVVRLIPTDAYDLAGLVAELREYARENGFTADGSDPRAFVNEFEQREWASRWPRWPRWLDRWMHGDGPLQV